MSKSLGNMYTLDQLQEMGYTPAALRYVLAGAYYRRPLNFTLTGMKDATSALNKLGRFDKELAKASGAKEPTYRDLVKKAPASDKFCSARGFRGGVPRKKHLPSAHSSLPGIVWKMT